ncbi:OprD family outer membrane porin [Pseudomonas sp. AF03-9]
MTQTCPPSGGTPKCLPALGGRETTWQVKYAYDFASVGVPGLSFMGMF